MSARRAVQHLRGWLKLVAALLLAAILLSGILAAPVAARPAQAIIASPQVSAPTSVNSNGVNGTLASFTALIPQFFSIDLPFVGQ